MAGYAAALLRHSARARGVNRAAHVVLPTRAAAMPKGPVRRRDRVRGGRRRSKGRRQHLASRGELSTSARGRR